MSKMELGEPPNDHAECLVYRHQLIQDVSAPASPFEQSDRRQLRRSHHWAKRRRRTEFVTTDTEESAIAPAANIGFKKPRAASGIAAVL